MRIVNGIPLSLGLLGHTCNHSPPGECDCRHGDVFESRRCDITRVSRPSHLPTFLFHQSAYSCDNQRMQSKRKPQQDVTLAINPGYQAKINRGLNNAYRSASIVAVELGEAKIIIFSDQHKGTGDHADDFLPSHPAYKAALLHYQAAGYTLAVLGDAEELWENTPSAVMGGYPSIFEIENKFHEDRQYWRFWGNHDDEWSNPAQVTRYLGKHFKDLIVKESLRLTIFDQGVDRGEIFMVHGHQGSWTSDDSGWVRWLVRYFWRPFQRIFRINTNTPATDRHLRHRHDIAMYNWAAASKGLVLIAGHTHHPIFPTQYRTEKLNREFETIRELGTDPDEIDEAQSDLRFAQAQEKPSYFNSGCCCFNDGRITGIEIEGGKIKLLRWPDEIGRPKPEILEVTDLRQVFQDVARREPPMRSA